MRPILEACADRAAGRFRRRGRELRRAQPEQVDESPVARNGSLTTSPVTVDSATTTAPSLSASSIGSAGTGRSTSCASLRTSPRRPAGRGESRSRRARRPDVRGPPAGARSPEVPPPTGRLVDPGVTAGNDRPDPDEENEDDQCDFHGRMIAEQVLSAQVEVFMTSITTANQLPRSARDGAADNWLGVEVRHLAALEAVARTGSFGRAALELGYTQSAVSQQIAALERIVGEKLVERPGGPRAVSMTEAGELLLRHAEAIVNRLDAARADMAALRAGETGTLRVATYQSISARVLPLVMRRFMADWPGSPSSCRSLPTTRRSTAVSRAARSTSGSAASPFRTARSTRSSSSPILTCSSSRRQPSRRTRQHLARRPRRGADDRGQPVLERQRRRGCAARARRADRLRLPLRRQHDPAGARRCTIRRRVDAAARDPAGRRPRQGDRPRPTRPPPPRSASSGTATATAPRRPAPSSRSPARSAPRSSGISSGRRGVPQPAQRTWPGQMHGPQWGLGRRSVRQKKTVGPALAARSAVPVLPPTGSARK